MVRNSSVCPPVSPVSPVPTCALWCSASCSCIAPPPAVDTRGRYPLPSAQEDLEKDGLVDVEDLMRILCELGRDWRLPY